MKLINHTESNIFINDIGIVVPISKHGIGIVREVDFNESKDVIALINSGKISVLSERREVEVLVKDGVEKFLLSGTTIWNGEGRTKPTMKADKYSITRDMVSEKRKYASTLKKKYRIFRKANINISLDAANVVMTKQNPSFLINEDVFQKTEIQKAIHSGLIGVSEVLEATADFSGKIVWVTASGEKPPEKPTFLVMDENPDFKGVQCIWEGPIFDAGGYANMNRQYVVNMTKMGVAIKPILVQTAVQIEEELKNEIVKFSYINVRPNCPKVFSTNVPGKHGGFTVAYTMMETDEQVHPALASSMNVANELWVPSEWNRETFINGGVKKPIKVMPLAIDERLYVPSEPRVVWNFPTKGYVFLAVSTWLWRKGYDVLLKAYSRAFSADDDVSLIIFTHVPLVDSTRFLSVIQKDIDSMHLSNPRPPNFTVVTSFVGASVTPLIYNSADCFVLFSRGEGWGLPYCEAIASGLPVIGADHGGQKMFLNNDNSFLVKPDLLTGCHPSLRVISPFYNGMHFASYSEKAIDEAAEKMKYVYENREKAKEIAFKCRQNLLDNFTWRKSAIRVASRLREVQ